MGGLALLFCGKSQADRLIVRNNLMGSFYFVFVALAAIAAWKIPALVKLTRAWHAGVSAMRRVKSLMPAHSENEICAAKWVVEDWLRCAQAHMAVSFLEEKIGVGADVIGDLLFRSSAEAITNGPDEFGDVLGHTLLKPITDADAKLDIANRTQNWEKLKKEAETLAMCLRAMDEGRNSAACRNADSGAVVVNS